MMNFKRVKEKELSARSVIYGALITLVLIFVIFCVYMVVMAIEFIAVVFGPVIFTIVMTGIALAVVLGVIQLVEAKRTRGKKEHEDT